jgi:hypothetical protein
MPVMDLSSTVSRFATGTYVVTRDARTYGADGRLDTTPSSTFQVTACVQPVAGKDLERLPDGMRTRDVLTIFTATELKEKDVVAWSGRQYEVDQVEPWSELGGYYRALATRVGD